MRNLEIINITGLARKIWSKSNKSNDTLRRRFEQKIEHHTFKISEVNLMILEAITLVNKFKKYKTEIKE